jgi:hypothetical protein
VVVVVEVDMTRFVVGNGGRVVLSVCTTVVVFGLGVWIMVETTIVWVGDSSALLVVSGPPSTGTTE